MATINMHMKFEIEIPKQTLLGGGIMIIIHMILDISLFYINYQQRQAQDGYV